MNAEDFGVDVPAIRLAWNRATSANPEQWSKQNPARGQCAVTACVVQDMIGGMLVRTVVTLPDGTEESHYANMDGNAVIIDLTDSQFPEGSEFGPWEERTREYVLGFQPTLDRYTLLKQRIMEVQTIDMVQMVGAEKAGEDEQE